MTQAYLVEVKTKQTTAGEMYDLLFDNGEKVGVGKFKPKNAEAGKYYEYEVKMNGNFKNLAPGSLKQVVAPPASAPAATSAKPAYSGGNGYDTRQDTISKQAAFNTAIALVKLMQDADALPIPASVKKDKKADALEAIVLDVAARFYHRATGNTLDLGDLQVEADLAAVEGETNWDE
jgi:hypothetical protein